VKHKFTLLYELDTTVPCAVAAYLDAEHYAFLHRKYEPDWEPLSDNGRTITVRQTWRYGIWRTGQVYTAEYVPPARFLQYDIRPSPRWVPSIHHLVKTRTDLRYYPNPDDTATVSHLEVEMDLPFFLWPLRRVIERKLCALKREKDAEDMAMIQRRARIFGRGNIKSYLAPHQFMLHKDEFVQHYGSGAAPISPPDAIDRVRA
jgi:hypothetical protein